MSLIEIAKTTDISNGQMKSFTAEGKEILIINYDNKYFAVDGRCTHMGGELAKGKLEGKIVTCPRHGAKFDVTTGSCISNPKIGFIKLKAKDEATYEVKVENNTIRINL
ncbi:Rieske (2Fe-2S) protein [Chloroflexota bacterium]